ncbi:excinuclease ABC subunit C [Bacteroidetes/Chlorobi group bacterium ChocPot_Mid]|nr:MAG: excinuclease ABC subunit C [Bacteroidetes/Chlorobi group bacterium ChocPot_Mid]
MIIESGQIEDEKIGLNEKLSSVPTNPGVYLHKDKNGKIIYVGKAKNLRNRVRSYFQQGRPMDAKTKALVSKIDDFEVIVVDSEAEAFILEDTLIKKHKPKYNILLRDDKSYPYVRVTKEDYPRLFPTRKLIRDGSRYFGPFTDVGHLKRILRVIRSLFMLRSCDYNLSDENVANKKYKICLDYHIKKCEGPCEGYISKEKYNENIEKSIRILNGKTKEIEKELLEKMQELSENMKFEEASIIKSRYLVLKDYLEHQKLVSPDLVDRDIFGLARIDNSACTLVFKVRDGKLTGKRHFIIQSAKEANDEELIQTTMEKWYMETDFIPKEIFLPVIPEQIEFITDWLRQKSEHAIEILVPKIGEKKKLVNLATANAEFMLRDYNLAMMKREQSVPRTVQALQRDLRLPKLPVRIECFDNSHFQGSELVSSCVVFVDGKPCKQDYRKFKIETVEKNDDFAAMREVVGRRYRRLIEEKGALPDLIIIDGGKGQLSGAVDVLKELGLSDKIVIIGLAKRLEEVFFPGKSESIMLPKTSSSLKLIQQVRDEAHRFAITFHRQLRDKRTFQTELTKISGIGKMKAQKLLIELGSVENIRNSEFEKLVDLVGEKSALALKEYFKNNQIDTSSLIL